MQMLAMDLRSKLEKEIQQAKWSDLEVHAQQDRLIVVDSKLNLLKVAVEVAADNSQVVSDWMNDNMVRKPTVEEIETWRQNQELNFQFVIVQPFVLIQSFSQ